MIKPTVEREQIRSDIAAFSRRLMLSGRVNELCEKEATPKQEEFLHRVLSEEIERRERSRKTRLLNRAGFPVFKSFDGYEFAEIPLPLTGKSSLAANSYRRRRTLCSTAGWVQERPILLLPWVSPLARWIGLSGSIRSQNWS